MYDGPLWVEDDSWGTQEVLESPEQALESDDETEQYYVDNDTFTTNKKSKTTGFYFETEYFSEIFHAIDESDHEHLKLILSQSPEALLESESTYNFSPLRFAIAVNNYQAVEIMLQHNVKVTSDDLNLAITKDAPICELLIKSAKSEDEKWSFYNEKNWQHTTLAHQVVIHPRDATMTTLLELSLVNGETVINPWIETASRCNLFMFMHERFCFTRFDEVLDFFIEHSKEPLSSELFISSYHGSILQAVISRIGSRPGEYSFCPTTNIVERILQHCPLLVNHTCEKYPITPLDMLNNKYIFSKNYEDNLQNAILALFDLIKRYGGMTTEELLSTPLPQPNHIKSAAQYYSKDQ